MDSEEAEAPEIALRLHDPRVMDSRRRLVDTEALSKDDLEGAVRVMDALFKWREAERRVTEASRRFMRLGDSDMKALRFAMFATDHGQHVTGRDLAEHLGISSASVTKLLDRLEQGGHIRRTPHPTDRRALAIVVSQGTRLAAEETLGREHARRFQVAAALDPAERDAVIRFLAALSDTGEGGWTEPSQP